MSGRRTKVIVHNHGVVAGAIRGDVYIGISPTPRPDPPEGRAAGQEHAPMTVSELLASLFDADALRRFLLSSPEYRGPALELPLPPASTVMVMFEAGEILRRHGLLNKALANQLVALFPGRQADIVLSARYW